MFAKYYQDELAWLREMGAELAAARPEMARFLGEPGADPDVERLLEGFAFLTGRIREKLDDEFPEITHGLMDMFSPHYLRPIPAMAILQVTPKPNLATEGAVLPRGSLVESNPVDGTRCRFRTASELRPAPVTLRSVELQHGHHPKLVLELQSRGAQANRRPGPLRLHLTGDPQVSRALFVALCAHVDTVQVRAGGAGATATPVPVRIRPGGLGDDEAALPTPPGSFRGFRLLQEYFAFPERFLFVDLHGLERHLGATTRLEFVFRQLPQDMPPVGNGNVLLDCVPVVNLFEHDADPMRAVAGRTEYRVRPAGKQSDHYEVHSVSRVSGRVRGAAQQESYRPYFSFEPRVSTDGRFYQLRRSESLRANGSDTYLRLGIQDPEQLSELDTISVDLVCSNRDLPTRLGPGDICHPAPDSPNAFQYRSIGTPSPPIQPPSGDEVHWRLLSHLTLNLRRIADRDSLCTALSLYDFRARTDRQARRRLDNLMQAIQKVTLGRGVELFEGLPVNGSDLRLEIDEEQAGGEGEVYLLGTILGEFFAHYVSLNSYSRLSIQCTGNNEVFAWPARIGQRISL
ncbi:MAG: type VI secretion system baseplate subunit TssF [Planctomycetota bacterium]